MDCYEVIKRQLDSELPVLEIATGAGSHTNAITSLGAKTTALDISKVVLPVLMSRKMGEVEIICSLMEKTPFYSNTFDYVLSCY